MNQKDLKVGDKVKLPNNMCGGGNFAIITAISFNEKGIISSLQFDKYDVNWNKKGSDSCSTCYEAYSNIELISGGKLNNSLGKIMSTLLEKVKLLTIGEPEKSFRKLGIQDEKGDLTSEGKALYDAWKFEQDKLAFKTAVCEPLLAEIEAEKSK